MKAGNRLCTQRQRSGVKGHPRSEDNAVNAEANAMEVIGCACMQMADGATEVQEAVVRLCCLWWQKELPGKADMVPQMIPYLLYQATVSGT